MKRRALLGAVGAAWLGSIYVYGGDSSDGDTSADSADAGGGGSVAVETETASPGGFDPREIEARFIERYNAMREREQAGQVHRDRFLSEMGQEHAENMAEHDYIGHVQPDTGMTIEDRFRDRGLLPECELEVSGTNEYYPGAENAAGAAVGRVTHPGTDETFTITDNDDVAEFLMSSWMSSEGHRAVMVLPAVDAIGLGVAVREDGEIFAALEFC